MGSEAVSQRTGHDADISKRTLSIQQSTIDMYLQLSQACPSSSDATASAIPVFVRSIEERFDPISFVMSDEPQRVVEEVAGGSWVLVVKGLSRLRIC